MALGRTFAGLMQGPQQFWDNILVSANQYPYRLSDNQRDALRIVGYVGNKIQREVSGSYGTAFERDDGRVVKVTTDPADLAAHVLLRKLPHVLDIYDVFKLEPAYPTRVGLTRRAPKTLYAMVVEHVDDLPWYVSRPGNFDKLDIRQIIEIAGGEFAVEAKPAKRQNFGKPNFEYPDSFRKHMANVCSAQDWSRTSNVSLKISDLKLAAKLDRESKDYCNRFVNQLFALSTAAARMGIELDDFHEGNFGIARSTNDWAIRDLGASPVYPDVQVRAVAGLAGLRTIR